MKDDEVIELGEAFSRLMSSPDYKPLDKFVAARIQTTSTAILQSNFKRLEDLYFSQGQLIGLAMAEGYMSDIVKRMNVIKEKRENEKRRRDSGTT